MRTVELRGRSFPARDQISEWQLMKLADAHFGDSRQRAMAATYRFIRHLLGDSWVEFERYVDELSADADVDLTAELDTMIGDYLTSITDRPTEKPSSSPDTERPEPSTSRVYSLSRGWISNTSGETDDSSSAAAAG